MTDLGIRVLLADDHPLVLEGIAALLSRRRDMTVVAMATNGAEAVNLYRAHRPHVAILDLRMPVMNGFEALAAIRADHATARVIILTTYDGDDQIYRAVRGGASGYLLKSSGGEVIASAILRVASGERYLPETVSSKLADHVEGSSLRAREIEVLTLAGRGLKNRAIASELNISVGTVKGYVVNILEKLGAQDRTDAVVIGLRRGIIAIESL